MCVVNVGGDDDCFSLNKKLAFFIWNLYRFSLFWFYISDLICSVLFIC